MPAPEEIEKINKEKFEKDYSLSQIAPFDSNATKDSIDYFDKLADLRLSLIKEYGRNKCVLDTGCASGEYLFKIKDIIKNGVGIDYCGQFINEASLNKIKLNVRNLNFVSANARKMPFKNESFELIFCFAMLYYIPQVEDVILESSRLLKNDGIAIFEFGNKRSLNIFVANEYKEHAVTLGTTIKNMKKILSQSSLRILNWRTFQILPLWGNKPTWLKPLLNNRWKKFLEKDKNGKMLDEEISGMPILRNFAFRHIVICQK